MTEQSDTEIKARIVQLWGDSLKRVDAQALRADVPLRRTRDFLTSVGLPQCDLPLEVTFHSGQELLVERVVNGAGYWVVGDDYGTKIALDAKEQVWSLGDGEMPNRAINTSLDRFVLFLGIYRSATPALKEATDEQASGIVDGLRGQFSALDPAALAEGENWWSVVLEQVEQGLL
jgi:hypothetical protein